MDVPAERKKVVQTDLEQRDYEMLQSIAKSKKITIKEAANEALRLWSASLIHLTEDPLFRVRPTKFKLKVRSDQIEAFLYKRKSR
jgi:hypothetical protein